MTTGASTYQQDSRDFFRKARRELPEDLTQASEKAWGAAAEIVKAISEEKGWAHQSHRSLYQNADALVQETGDQQLRVWFAVAGALHINFYENWSSRSVVEAGTDDVERFVERVETLLTPPNP